MSITALTYKFRPITALTNQFLPNVIPAGWTQIPTPEVCAGSAVYQSQTLLVVFSADKHHETNETWVHVSVSHRDRLPNWDELKFVKEVFLGRDKLAIQVLPPAEEYVNLHPNVLHLWHCPDRRIVPDLR